MGAGEGIGHNFMTTGYFRNYSALPYTWRFEVELIDGEWAARMDREEDGAWVPHTAKRFVVEDGVVVAIRDYVHVDYLLAST